MSFGFIPYGRQDISEDDIKSVVEVLKSEYLTQGPKVPEFEKAIVDYCRSKYAVAVNSATSALHIAYLALEVGPGDIVWTSPNTFVATANAALYCGADVDFVDIDPQSYNIDIRKLKEKLEWANTVGRLPKLVVPVHFAGQPCDMREIWELSTQYGFKIVEDASHAIGASYLNDKVGSCRYSDITVFSFHPVKIITTAEGGIATTNDREIAHRMTLLRSHGITRDPVLMSKKSEGDWYYQQIGLGFNYRMTELQAALGISQMMKIDSFIAQRHALAKKYNNSLNNLPIICPVQLNDRVSSYHLYPIRITDECCHDRAKVFSELRALNIGVNVHYIPVHLQPYYQKRGFQAGQFDVAEKYYAQAISIPMYAGLGSNIDIVIQQLQKILIR